MRSLSGLFVTCVAAASLTACGGGSEDAAGPSCDDVWVVGGTLPQDYEGCVGADGEMWLGGPSYTCPDDTKVISVAADDGELAMWASPGQEIADYGNGDAFNKATRGCESDFAS